jgi:anti-anti-sigma factor
MMKEFSVQVCQYNDEIKIADIFGTFDCYTIAMIRQEFQKLVEEGNYNLLVNLGHVEFMNIKAIRVLVNIADELRQDRREMKVCSLPERIERLFNLMGVKKVLPVYENEWEALRHFIKRSNTGHFSYTNATNWTIHAPFAR